MTWISLLKKLDEEGKQNKTHANSAEVETNLEYRPEGYFDGKETIDIRKLGYTGLGPEKLTVIYQNNLVYSSNPWCSQPLNAN